MQRSGCSTASFREGGAPAASDLLTAPPGSATRLPRPAAAIERCQLTAADGDPRQASRSATAARCATIPAAAGAAHRPRSHQEALCPRPVSSATSTRQSEDFPGWYNDVVLKARAGRLLAGARLHDHPALRLRHLGVDARRARPAHQAHRAQQRLLPALRAQVAPRARGRARRGLRPAGRLGHARRRRGARRAAGHPAHQRGHHRRGREGLDPVLPGPAAAHEPLEQRRPLGAAHAPLPAHRRVPVAGGAHLPRHARRRPPTRWPPAWRPTARSPRTGWPSRSSRAARAAPRRSRGPSTRTPSRP